MSRWRSVSPPFPYTTSASTFAAGAAGAAPCARARSSGSARVAPRLPRNSRRVRSWLGIDRLLNEKAARILSHQHDLADVLARFHQRVCSRGLLERKRPVDD